MAQEGGVGARPRWRDALVVLVLAGVIVTGLVHYGRGLEADGSDGAGDRSRTSAVRDGAPEPSPTADETATLGSAPTADPTAPAERSGGTCWDGRATTSLRLCGLPDGPNGLAWVFPSFARDREACHRIEPHPDSWPAVASYECFLSALDQPVAVVYDQIEEPASVHRWLVRWLGSERVRELPGPNGGRWIAKDGRTRPVRITGLYQRFPYVVSVYADNPRAAARAWRVLVQMRAEDKIRGVAHG